MKKLLVLVTALIVVLAVTAQENKVQKDLKSYLAFSAGPSFPAGDFASANENNEDAGYAKTGININLRYGINLAKYAGVEIMGMDGFHKLDNSLLGDVGAKLDHYQYYGLMAGPAFREGGDNVEFSARFLAGFANTNSPKLVVSNETIMKEDWVGTFAWSTGAELRYNFNKKVFFLLKTDYSEMRPEFTVTIGNERITDKRRMSIVNVNLGAGLRF